MEWNGTEISVWNMEDARMEWNGRFQEWNGRQSSILPSQFRTKFRALYLQKSIYRCRVVINHIVTEAFNYACYLRILFLDKSRYFGCVQRWSPRGRPWPRGRPRGHILKSLALASKPQVLGLSLGLEALGPRKLPCPRLEDSTIFKPLKFC